MAGLSSVAIGCRWGLLRLVGTAVAVVVLEEGGDSPAGVQGRLTVL